MWSRGGLHLCGVAFDLVSCSITHSARLTRSIEDGSTVSGMLSQEATCPAPGHRYATLNILPFSRSRRSSDISLLLNPYTSSSPSQPWYGNGH